MWLQRTCALLATTLIATAAAPALAERNSLGMEMARIPAGKFLMGATKEQGGEWDESPPREVSIAAGFLISATEVTNAQYEQFDPKHKALRGRHGVSKEDDEAVVFVTWHDAHRFCKWLSEKEGKAYRLPTEAEWEYACRAGTATKYHTGDELPNKFQKNAREEWDPKPVPLHVAKTAANAWGLYDMHGNVEEWCFDWYGPYEPAAAADPVGPEKGLFRVMRGGSHSTLPAFLRSANRLATLPDDSSWLIGFRVVQAEMPATKPTPDRSAWAQNDVVQNRHDWAGGPPAEKPYFEPPIRFVNIPEGANGPMYAKHNHCPDIDWLANGDLFATWYSCNTESGRELTVVASRLRKGHKEWDAPQVLYKAADRNMHATAIWFDGDRTLYHFNGISSAHGWGQLAQIVRTSTDNAVSWSEPAWVSREHQYRNQAIAGVFRMRDGTIVFPSDAVPGGNGGTAIHVSRDGGRTWVDPAVEAKTEPLRPEKYVQGGKGVTIAGIHAGVVELSDGRLMALGRGDNIAGKMPMSISSDAGRSWSYSTSEFPPISSGQRLVLMRLREGPILFCSFTGPGGMEFKDARGGTFKGVGLYAAVSEDDGRTWPVKKLITPGKGAFDGGAWTKLFQADDTHAEPKGYLAATQSPDGVVHLISSALHYRFNLAWVRRMPEM